MSNEIHGELKKEFQLNQEKRKIKYVLFTTESAKKKISVDSTEIKKFLENPTQVNLAKMKYDTLKEVTYKGKTFEAVRETIARDLIAGDKKDEILMEFDQPVKWDNSLTNQFYIDGEKGPTLKGDHIAEEFQTLVEQYVHRTYARKAAQ